MPPFNPTLVVLGCVGGMLPDILRIIKGHHGSALPSYLKELNFWVGTVLLVVLGGFAAWVLGATQAKEALMFGYAAPEFLSKLAASGQAPPDRGGFRLRTWWAS